MSACPADTSHPAVAATAAAPGLYRQVLGPRYDLLSARLRALHGRQGLRAYRGEVVAERGRSWLSRLCAWAARLPPAYAGAIEVEIAGDAASGCFGLIWPRKLPIGWRALRIGLPGYTVLSRQLGIEQVQGPRLPAGRAIAGPGRR
ncbi:hypothetical protein [Lysobacter sp. Root667]|uniref:hypothetical protein n=1 Tax=Lysobacter sp. Root667 TaxID=1736581 RepID=UPI000AA40611|nr:hypothetical protein [Lysobacter sp. Root667]